MWWFSLALCDEQEREMKWTGQYRNLCETMNQIGLTDSNFPNQIRIGCNSYYSTRRIASLLRGNLSNDRREIVIQALIKRLSVVISYGLSYTKFNCSNGTDFYKIAAKCVLSTVVLR